MIQHTFCPLNILDANVPQYEMEEQFLHFDLKVNDMKRHLIMIGF